MTDKNLFPYNLAVVAIFKNEAPYLREWIDYHLLAGVEHFYLYNNSSDDGYEKILAPYVEANLVTLIDWPGTVMQMPAFNDALERFKFLCRYMAFIDLDEFIFPKTNQSIVEVVDEILSRDEHWAALVMNWQIFGSNGHETADYSRGVLERFIRRAPCDWVQYPEKVPDFQFGNSHVKTIANPRAVNVFGNSHFAIYFANFHAVNENGNDVYKYFNVPVTADKLVVNHYYSRSREEFLIKLRRGRSDIAVGYLFDLFDAYDCNDVFDDSILSYRDARAKNFLLESDAQRRNRVEKALVDTLTQCSPFDAPEEFFIGKLTVFLTCRKLAEVFGTKIGSRSAEEYALVWIYHTLGQDNALAYEELQLFADELLEILLRPFPVAEKIVRRFSEQVLPSMIDAARYFRPWEEIKELDFLRRILNLILR